SFVKPQGTSAHHWNFQEKLAAPNLEGDTIVYTSSQPFGLQDAESWWLAYDMICGVDQELKDVDAILQGRNRGRLCARQVKGAGNPDFFSQFVQVCGWRPVDAKLRVSDVAKVVSVLGGEKLYGDDPRFAVRELLQNSSDAIAARRKLEKRPNDWGDI